MSKKHRQHSPPPTDWDTERSLADAEADDAPVDDGPPLDSGGAGTCICGSDELLLQAYFAVKNGAVAPTPLEVEGLTCPECGREYEAVQLEDGRVVRGEFVGFADLDDNGED